MAEKRPSGSMVVVQVRLWHRCGSIDIATAGSLPHCEKLRMRIPSRRFNELQDLDGPILLLASDAGKGMSGSTITVDGAHLVSSL